MRTSPSGSSSPSTSGGASDDALAIWNANHNATTGLVANEVNENGGLGTSNQSYVDYNGCRVPWRSVLDYLWYGTASAKTFTDRITDWVDTKGPASLVDGYGTDGTPRGGWNGSSCFNGGYATGAMSKSQDRVDRFSQCFKSQAADSYYETSLRSLYMLLLSGNMWIPGSSVAGGSDAGNPPTGSGAAAGGGAAPGGDGGPREPAPGIDDRAPAPAERSAGRCPRGPVAPWLGLLGPAPVLDAAPEQLGELLDLVQREERRDLLANGVLGLVGAEEAGALPPRRCASTTADVDSTLHRGAQRAARGSQSRPRQRGPRDRDEAKTIGTPRDRCPRRLF